MNENVKKFFDRYNSDPALQKRVKDAETAYPGSLELREPLVEAVLLPEARELGLGFTVKELWEYETLHFVRHHQDVELTPEELAAPTDETEYWLINRGWSSDEAKFCPGGEQKPHLIRIERKEK